MNSKLLFFNTDNDVTLSVMISSIDIVELKGGRPCHCYSQLHYIAESDFFSFHAIQMPEMLNFEIEPDITSQCISNHTSGIIVVKCVVGYCVSF